MKRNCPSLEILRMSSVTEIQLPKFTGTYVEYHSDVNNSTFEYHDVTLQEDATLRCVVLRRPTLYKAGTEFDKFNVCISHEIVDGNLRVTTTCFGVNMR